MAEHTPGPWTVGERPGDRPFCVVNFDARTAVCQAWTRANARLLAAAPDLLAACEGVMRRVNAGLSPTAAEFAAVEFAIAKATGNTEG